MRNHLSQEQLANCFVGRYNPAELQHLNECAQCRAEPDLLSSAITSFRSALRDRIDDQVALHKPAGVQVQLEPVSPGSHVWRWALAAAALFLFVIVPIFTPRPAPQVVINKATTEATAEALMDVVNRHLSRNVPESMEPMMVLISGDEWQIESGGVQ